MSSADKYAKPVDVNERWTVGVNSPTQFTWEYDDGRDRLINLYQKGKDKQWDTTKRIDWSIPVIEHNPIGLPDEFKGVIYDTASISTLCAIAAAREAAGL